MADWRRVACPTCGVPSGERCRDARRRKPEQYTDPLACALAADRGRKLTPCAERVLAAGLDVQEAGQKYERDPVCVEAWPECESGGYDPRCCRFPKSCSCMMPAGDVQEAEGK